MIREVEIFENFMGFDAMIRVEFEITAWATPAYFDPIYGGEPANGPEWEVLEIGVTLTIDDEDRAEWKPDWREHQWGVIACSADVVNSILEVIEEEDACRPHRRHRRGSHHPWGWL